MANMNSFPVPKKVEKQMPVGGKGDPKGNAKSNVSMPAPAAQGHPKMKAAVTNDPYFQNEFNAENDLKTLIAAARIKGDKKRMNDAMHRYNELKGANNKGVRGPKNNSFDNLKMTRMGTDGTKMDGSKGRW